MSGSMTREDFDAYLVPCLPRAVYSGQSGGLPRLGPAGERIYRYGGRHRSERPGPCSPGAGSGPAGSTGETVAYRQWLYQRAGAAAGENPRAVDVCRQGVFCNSGAEANEAALKLARKYAHDKFGGEKAKSSPSTTPSTAARCSPSPLAASRNIPAIMLRCRRALPICPITISRRSPRRSPRAPAR